MITSYEEMSVGTYLMLMDIIEDKSLDEELRNVECVALLSGRSAEELMDIPFVDYRMVASACDFLNHQPKIGKPRKSYRLGDFDCRVELRPEMISTAQYIDFKEFASSAQNQLVRFLSIFIIPKGKRYNEGYDMLSLHDAIREHLPITEAQAITAFFFSALHASTLNILRSSAKMMRKVKGKNANEKIKMAEMIKAMRALIHSYENGAGIIGSTFSLLLPERLGAMYTHGALASS